MIVTMTVTVTVTLSLTFRVISIDPMEDPLDQSTHL